MSAKGFLAQISLICFPDEFFKRMDETNRDIESDVDAARERSTAGDGAGTGAYDQHECLVFWGSGRWRRRARRWHRCWTAGQLGSAAARLPCLHLCQRLDRAPSTDHSLLGLDAVSNCL